MLFGQHGRVDAVVEALPGWLIRLRPLRGLSTPVRYGITTALVLAVFAIRWWLDLQFANVTPFLLFLPVVAAVGLLFDHGTSVYAALLSTALGLFFFVEPRFSFAIPDFATGLHIAVYLSVALFIAVTSEALRRVISRIEDLVDELAEDAEHTRLIIEGATDYAIFTTDTKGRITSWCPGAQAIFGYTEAEMAGEDGAILFTPEDRGAEVPQDELATAHSEGCAADERWHIRKDGSRFWASGSVRVLHDGKGRERGFLKIARDATEQKRAQVSMEQSLEQQQLLNREASHRVKNSLHLVASLLTLQARTLKDPEGQRAINEAVARVSTIAQVHDQLWRQPTAEAVDLDVLLADLCAHLRETAPNHSLVLETEPVTVPSDKAIPLALLVNEIVTNAFKYAYPGGAGEVRVTLSVPEARLIRLEIADQGIGLPEDFDLASRSGSLGVRLIANLTRQLGADIKVTSGNSGACFSISTPL
jgi:PAS domain S-box-containing protein